MTLGVIGAGPIGSIHNAGHDPNVPGLLITDITARWAPFPVTQPDALTAVQHALAAPAMPDRWDHVGLPRPNRRTP